MNKQANLRCRLSVYGVCGVEQSLAGRVSDCCGSGRHVQPGQNVGDMAMDRVTAQYKALGYFLVAQATGNEPEHLLLPWRQEALLSPFRCFRCDLECIPEMA